MPNLVNIHGMVALHLTRVRTRGREGAAVYHYQFKRIEMPKHVSNGVYPFPRVQPGLP